MLKLNTYREKKTAEPNKYNSYRMATEKRGTNCQLQVAMVTTNCHSGWGGRYGLKVISQYYVVVFQ